MLVVTGFKAEFVDLIMECVTIAQLAVCWNGKLLDPFKSSWGLQQGDPLFPYLFVLCMEVFNRESPRRLRTGVGHLLGSVSRYWYIPYLLADDFLLVGEASFSQARLMEHILAKVCGILGQRINRLKSQI